MFYLETEKADFIIMIILIVFGVVTLIVGSVLASNQAWQPCLKRFDLHRHEHNYIEGPPMTVKLTAIGGTFSILFVLSFLFLPFVFIIEYVLANIHE